MGSMNITAIDDAMNKCGPVPFEIGPAESFHFTSSHLEEADEGSRLRTAGGGRGGTGHWRLEIKSDVPLVAHGYVRTSDGFVTSMQQHARAAELK